MEKWIDILTEREDQTIPLLWSWDLSGNILELSVPAGIKNEIDKYRLSVLQVGKIIQRIRNSYPDSSEKPSVQLFPNLMDIGLVAVVRAPETNMLKTSGLSINGKSESFEDLLEKGRKDFSLNMDEIKLTENLQNSIQTDSGEYRTYLLSCSVSNPFVWVRTGYFLELIQNFYTEKLLNKKLKTIEKIDNTTKQELSSILQKNTIPQALIMIEV